jgi:lipopolysaccharide export LptBFGC system permease protein LptF
VNTRKPGGGPQRRPANRPQNRPQSQDRAADRYGDTTTQRTAFVPSVLAAMALLVGTAFVGQDGFSVIRYVVAILALIVLVFAYQGKAWWAVVVLAAITVLWNPVAPFGFDGGGWFTAQVVAAAVFVVIGVQVKVPTGEQQQGRGR